MGEGAGEGAGERTNRSSVAQVKHNFLLTLTVDKKKKHKNPSSAFRKSIRVSVKRNIAILEKYRRLYVELLFSPTVLHWNKQQINFSGTLITEDTPLLPDWWSTDGQLMSSLMKRHGGF